MTRYFLGIELEGTSEEKVSMGYYGTDEAGDRLELIKPEGMTWLNGEPLQIGLRNRPIGDYPVVSNRPTDDNTDAPTLEMLTYDHNLSRPIAEERTAVYYPINSGGLLDVLQHGELRQIRVTMVAEYFAHSGIVAPGVQDLKLNIPEAYQNTAIAA